MTNPFCLPGCTLEEPGPLNPNKNEKHLDYYADVDSSEKAYQNFLKAFNHWNIPGTGAAMLVYGDTGCGKTSLINRCAYYIKETIKDKKWLIVDRSNENLNGLHSYDKCENVLDAVRRHIYMDENFLSEQNRNYIYNLTIGSNENTLRRAIEEIVARLKKEDCMLIIILPKIEIDKEIEKYLAILLREYIFVIMESNEPSIGEYIDRQNSNPISKKRILNLNLGPLTVEQGWEFINKRIARMDKTISLPVFDKVGVDKYMTERSQYNKVSVRELEKICIYLFEEAINRKETAVISQEGSSSPKYDKIDYNSFADLWLRRGGIIR